MSPKTKLPKLSQCVQVFAWRNSLPRLAVPVPPRAAVFRYRQGRCASLLLGCPPGPLVSCALRGQLPGCPAGLAAWAPSRAACFFVPCGAGPAAWVPCGAGCLGALRGLVSWVPCVPAAWVPSGPRSACSAAACHHRALTEITIKNFSGSRTFFPLFFLTLMGTEKTFWSPKSFFSLLAHALKAISAHLVF